MSFPPVVSKTEWRPAHERAVAALSWRRHDEYELAAEPPAGSGARR